MFSAAMTGVNIKLLTAMYRKLLPVTSEVGQVNVKMAYADKRPVERSCAPLQPVFEDSCLQSLRTCLGATFYPWACSVSRLRS